MIINRLPIYMKDYFVLAKDIYDKLEITTNTKIIYTRKHPIVPKASGLIYFDYKPIMIYITRKAIKKDIVEYVIVHELRHLWQYEYWDLDKKKLRDPIIKVGMELDAVSYAKKWTESHGFKSYLPQNGLKFLQRFLWFYGIQLESVDDIEKAWKKYRFWPLIEYIPPVW